MQVLIQNSSKFKRYKLSFKQIMKNFHLSRELKSLICSESLTHSTKGEGVSFKYMNLMKY